MTYGYIRVSTEKQTVENQRFEILRFAQQQGPHRGRLDRGDHLRHQNYDKRKLGGLLGAVQEGTSFSARSCPAWVGVCL